MTPPQQRTAWRELATISHHTEEAIAEVCQRVQATPIKGIGRSVGPRRSASIPSPIGWMGGKASIAEQIVALLPKHDVYVEPFLGGGSVLLAKPPSKVELVNDIHGEIINFFAVLRDAEQAARLKHLVQLTPYARDEHRSCCASPASEDPVERARCFFVTVRQSFGHAENETWKRALGGIQSPTRKYCNAVDRLDSYVERLRRVQIECRDFRKVLARCDKPGVCVYADPPYIRATRHQQGEKYKHEMSEADHEQLLDILCGFKRARVVLSGHDSEMYNRRLIRWTRYEFSVTAKGLYQKSGRSRRTEVVWVSL